MCRLRACGNGAFWYEHSRTDCGQYQLYEGVCSIKCGRKSHLKKAVELIRNDIAIACTGCAYCVEDCPQNIAIPDYFKIYNRYKQLQGTTEKWDRQNYANRAKERGKASECVECGLCEGHCPQHLEIRALLKEVAEALE